MRSEAGRWLLGAAAAGAGAVWLWRHQDEVMTRRPLNEWTFTHMNLLLPTEGVRRGGDVFPLPRRPRPLEVTYGFEGRERSLAELHARTHTTSFVVLHGGEIVHESYPGYFAGDDVRFQLFSMTKSVTSMLIGIALDEEAIKDVTEPVTVYCRGLAGSAFDEVTIEQLLDMGSGVGDLEDYTVRDSLINRFAMAATGGGSLHEVVSSAERSTKAGTQFNYSTIDTQVLGWVLESATGRSLAQYATERLWSRIGAEHDAYYWLTRGHPRTAIMRRLAQCHRPRPGPAGAADVPGRRPERAAHPARGMGDAQPGARRAAPGGRCAGPQRLPVLRVQQQVVDARRRATSVHRGGDPRPVPVCGPGRRRGDRQDQRVADGGRHLA